MFAPIRASSVIVAVAATLAVTAGQASAATACGKHDDITRALSSRYKETRHVMAVVNSKMVMEIFTSPKGTWTVLVTDTSGKSCITAAGDNWQEVKAKVAGLDS